MLLILSVLLSIPVVALGQTASRADEDAVRAVVRRYVEAREKRDAQALAALFTADADQLVSTGEWRRGRDAVVKGSLASSAQTGGVRAITVEAVRAVAAGVAVADGRYEISGLEGGAARRMWTTFVLVREPRGWLISSYGTCCQPIDQRHLKCRAA
jgi:uncharacterized protein (TIGR02246 family)